MTKFEFNKTGASATLIGGLILGGGLLALGAAALACWSGRHTKGRRLFPEMKGWYEGRMKSLLIEWNRELHSLRKKATTATLSTRTHLYRQIELLEGKLGQMESLLRELRHTSETGWPKFRRIVEKSFEDIRTTFKDLQTKSPLTRE